MTVPCNVSFRILNLKFICCLDFVICDLLKGRVAELADALDLGSSGATRGGSTPSTPTSKIVRKSGSVKARKSKSASPLFML